MFDTTARKNYGQALDNAPSPADFPLGSPESRAAARARLLAFSGGLERHVITVSIIGIPLNLSASNCVRRRSSDGAEWAVARLRGRREDITNAELEAWINSFPIAAS